jgi:ketosteroid isomerase-like protein
MRRLFASLGLVLTSTACHIASSRDLSAPAPRASPIDSATRARSDDAAIRAALARYVEVYNAGAPRDAFVIIGDSAQIGWNSRGDSIPFQLGLARTTETARRLGADPAAPRRYYSVEVEEVILSGNLALVRDVWTTTTRDPDSTTVRRDRSFELFRRQTDWGWKIFRWVDLPAAGGPIATARVTCAPSDSASEVLIRRRLADWVRQTNLGDQAAAASIWAPTVKGWFPQGAEFRDTAAYAAAGRRPATARAASSYDLEIDEVAVSGDLAVVHDRWTERRRLAPGSTVIRTIRGSETWRCQPGGDWRIARWVSAPEHWRAAPDSTRPYRP